MTNKPDAVTFLFQFIAIISPQMDASALGALHLPNQGPLLSMTNMGVHLIIPETMTI